eukprot:3938922-Rhodomonas_salina.4
MSRASAVSVHLTLKSQSLLARCQSWSDAKLADEGLVSGCSCQPRAPHQGRAHGQWLGSAHVCAQGQHPAPPLQARAARACMPAQCGELLLAWHGHSHGN